MLVAASLIDLDRGDAGDFLDARADHVFDILRVVENRRRVTRQCLQEEVRQCRSLAVATA